jgi:hypothetical protein
VTTLRDSLDAWQDVDSAEHTLATLLGIVPATSAMHHYKWMYWSANPTGAALHECLMVLIRAGILESREGETEVRWSPTWQPPPTSTP